MDPERWLSPRAVSRLVNATRSQLGHEMNIQVRFDGRYKHAVGVARWRIDGNHEIHLSSRWWGSLSNEARRETIVHETCHITTFEELCGAPPPDDHCALWFEHMAHVGYRHPIMSL